MESLPYTKEEARIVEYGDLEEFATEHLGLKNYEYVAVQECCNGSYQRYRVPSGCNTDWEKKEKNKILETGDVPIYGNSRVFDLLHEKGLVEPGNYIVHVYW